MLVKNNVVENRVKKWKTQKPREGPPSGGSGWEGREEGKRNNEDNKNV